ncbi:hypothetical protein SERLADRAFT_431789 [Serpula lacrymans var. lacrymans S7.9]|uniref:Uncharacterized protein n=1 Tax=Serpula lacrymans var. lacrymans (strain S7.9) TaxID=578457 RepID=F8NDE7_SERL9|nr:uncharacterized protein SERLADRAFT_431789 [Serpula lacrymans var. lacrymans S7.9]EGO30285.1 hypothetical protein SERLADRAFT_431789 [Serpula lacrymans var. lacrymans S7.9]
MILEARSPCSVVQGTPRPLKRRHPSLSELPFFTPAASSFNPPPYGGSGEGQQRGRLPLFSHSHSAGKPMHSLPALDPLPSDPHVLFIHPPFTSFPNSELFSEGLSYSLMSANPDWFLDPSDFISSNTSNLATMAYPPQLEPPRGWCPAKQRNIKVSSSDGWPDGEEPRLRCTFCRRTYAGVNAKSMWRRHVYEKHKIAMSNRRDGSERYRNGRGTCRKAKFSDKENDGDGTTCEGKVCKSKSINMCAVRSPLGSSTPPSIKLKQPWHSPVTSSSGHKDRHAVTHREHILEQQPSCSSPVDTAVCCPDNQFALEDMPVRPLLSVGTLSSMESVNPTIPPSPYNPLRTPSFRHSAPQLPSDQPWRFPSPSHPLHSRNREFCLSTLARGVVSPEHRELPIVSHNKTFVNVFRSPKDTNEKRFSDYNICDSKLSYSLTVPLEASPSLFQSHHSPTLLGRDDMSSRRIDEPYKVSRDDPFTGPKETTKDIDMPQSWEVSTLADNDRSETIYLASDDPFGRLYRPWFDGSAAQHKANCVGNVSPEVGSPVLRNPCGGQWHGISVQRANLFRIEGQEQNQCYPLLSENGAIDALLSSMENIDETRTVDSGIHGDGVLVVQSDFGNDHRFGQKAKKIRKF